MNHKKIILICAVVVCCVAVTGLLLHAQSNDLGQQWNELHQEIYKLPSDTTAEELEADGFLNLTDIQSERMGNVNSFFKTGKSVLKTFLVAEDEILIRVFARNKDTGYIVISLYHIKSGIAEDAGYILQAQLEEIEAEDGTIEVWLRGTVKSVPAIVNPSPEDTQYDMLLYRYRK